MMMSKPAPAAKKAEPETKKVDAVADLERRLKILSSNVPETAPAVVETVEAPPAFATPPPEAAPGVAATKPAAAAAPSGKNALLARIMAAQERAKQQQQTTAPAAAPDLLSGDAAPPAAAAAPPAFDAAQLPPPAVDEPPPPAFDDSLLAPPPTEQQQAPPPAAAPTMVWDPHAPPPPPEEAAAAPAPSAAAPSAPAFDLLAPPADETAAPPLPAPVQPPPQQQQEFGGIDEEALQAILGMEGLSEAEKKALIAEQVKIMASIERNKQQAATSAADAFESRSFSAAVGAVGRGNRSVAIGGDQTAVVHGTDATNQAIQDGTALQVQCTSCENWMQVTADASMMLCPVCQTVSPVDLQLAVTAAEAAQMQADKELAEALQKEEYTAADRAAARQRAQEAARKKKEAQAAAAAGSGSWMEWLGLSSSTATTGPQAQQTASPERGHLGVSRPPGAAAPSSSASRSSPPDTAIRPSNSYDAEADALLATRRPAARVAESQPLFACVTDSINQAATAAYQAATQDDEGNVHGVDSSSLLAVTNVGRASSDTKYEQLNNNNSGEK